MKTLPFPGRRRMLLDSDFKAREEEKRKWRDFWGGVLSSSHITWERMRKVTQILLPFMITPLISVFPQEFCSGFTGFAQSSVILNFPCCCKLAENTRLVHPRCPPPTPTSKYPLTQLTYSPRWVSVHFLWWFSNNTNHSHVFTSHSVRGEKGRKITFGLYMMRPSPKWFWCGPAQNRSSAAQPRQFCRGLKDQSGDSASAEGLPRFAAAWTCSHGDAAACSCDQRCDDANGSSLHFCSWPNVCWRWADG